MTPEMYNYGQFYISYALFSGVMYLHETNDNVLLEMRAQIRAQ